MKRLKNWGYLIIPHLILRIFLEMLRVKIFMSTLWRTCIELMFRDHWFISLKRKCHLQLTILLAKKMPVQRIPIVQASVIARVELWIVPIVNSKVRLRHYRHYGFRNNSLVSFHNFCIQIRKLKHTKLFG